MARLKTVLHVHTNYSYDSNMSPREAVEEARRAGVDCLGITDHDDLRGALEVCNCRGVRVIVGAEISTADGHLIGLFLEEPVPPDLSARETAERIRAQGGLVLIPHPFCWLAHDHLGKHAAQLAPLIDAVEVHNAQNPLPWVDWRAARFAAQYNLPGFVGADAHLRGYQMPCCQIMDDFDGPQAFLESLRGAELHRGRFGPVYFATMGLQDLHRRLTGRPAPGFGSNATVVGVGNPG